MDTFEARSGATPDGTQHADPAAAPTGRDSVSSRRRVVLAASAGTFIEYYDFAIYGAFAPVLAAVFFPTQNPTAALLSTFAVFASAFVARPLGAIIWGPLGDRVGRQRVLVITLILMSVATLGIGLIPPYAAIGVLAPLVLVVARLLQGISAGGEMPGAAIFTAEHSPDNQRGYLVSWLQVAVVGSLLTGLLVSATITASLSTDALHTWGWRVPFLVAAPLGLIGFYVRRRLTDSPNFRALENAGTVARNPIRITLSNRGNYRRMVIAVGYGPDLAHELILRKINRL